MSHVWRILSFCMLLVLLPFAFEQQAHAYADPGSGLLLFQAAASVITGVFYLCRKKLHTLLSRRRSS